MDDDRIKGLAGTRLPVYLVDEPPIYTGHATTEELLREQEVIRWHIAAAEHDYGIDSLEAQIVANLMAGELTSIDAELQRRFLAKAMPSAPRWPSAPEDKRSEWDEIKRRTDIVWLADKVIGHGNKKGGVEWYRCFAHEDKTPSLAVYPASDDQHFHCFSCGMHGDVIDLARHAMHLTSFQATMAVLGEWAGVTTRTVAIVKDGETVEVKPE
jgi:hypothetical protein